MKFTLRIRLYLILIALIPPLAVMAVLYQSSLDEQELNARQQMHEQLSRGLILKTQFRSDLRDALTEAGNRYTNLVQLRSYSQRNRSHNQYLKQLNSDLNFVELVDSFGFVLSSADRPSLPGEQLLLSESFSVTANDNVYSVVEYDRGGRHAAIAGTFKINDTTYLYGGQYLDEKILNLWAALTESELELLFEEDSVAMFESFVRMEPLLVYQTDSVYEARLEGGPGDGYILRMKFRPGNSLQILSSLLGVTSLVAALSVAAAVLLGMFISGRARREISNLVDATSRVAAGDFSIPVMAYEEGEFSQLADSFSAMMTHLQKSQKQLAASEKIAAWEMMGRKIAHEIKNPLTPISISNDDIYRSYIEKLPNFDQTIEKNCGMIKVEIKRLTSLLDEFIKFARMKPSQPARTTLQPLLDEISTLYTVELEQEKLKIENRSTRRFVHIDSTTIKQLSINLIKNALELDDINKINVTIIDDADKLVLIVEDDGPGFPNDQLEQPFQPEMSTKKGGSGLGLVICQRIVIDHEGHIELYNKKPKGAGIRISIPQSDG